MIEYECNAAAALRTRDGQQFIIIPFHFIKGKIISIVISFTYFSFHSFVYMTEIGF